MTTCTVLDASSSRALSRNASMAAPLLHARAAQPLVAAEGAQLPDLLGGGVDQLRPLGALGGRDPGELDAAHVDAQEIEQAAEDDPAPAGVEIAAAVVAVVGMAAGDDDAVGAVGERLQQQHEVDAPGAGEADDGDLRRVLHAAGAGQVGA